MLAGEEHGLDVDRHQPVPVGLVEVHWAAERLESDIVEEDVDLPPCADAGGHRRLDLGRHRHVGLPGLRLTPFGLNFRRGFLGGRPVPVHAEDARALPRHQYRARLAV